MSPARWFSWATERGRCEVAGRIKQRGGFSRPAAFVFRVGGTTASSHGREPVVACYAGTASLERELKQVGRPTEARIGDVFIQGGYPGHAVIIVDVARHDRPGRKIMLLAQSFMPAQEMHVLKNPRSPALDPWFEAEFDKTLTTPHWVFQTEHLRRF